MSPGAAASTQLGRGDFNLYLDWASFRGRDGKDLVTVSMRVANQDLKFDETKSGWTSRIKLNLLVTDDADAEKVKTAETMTFHETNGSGVESPVAYQTIVKQFSLPPGGYWLSVALEDLQAPKMTMVGLTQGANHTSAVRRARLNVPEIPAGEASFSDALFVWDIDPREQGVRRYRPNPSRMYGLHRDSLTVYVEIYLPETLAMSPEFEFWSEIATAAGDPVRENRVSLPNPRPGGTSGTFPVVIREDLATLEAGSYALYLTFAPEGEPHSRVKAGDFTVAWDIRTWEVPRREYLAEARFLLGDDEFKDFQNGTPGEQEKLLDELWRAFDPDPTTGVNEAYETFIERLDYINAHYDEDGAALFADRGNVYLRYGPPDDFVQDVIPLNYDTLAEAEEAVENKYHPIDLSSSGGKFYSTQKTRNSFTTQGKSTARYRPEDNTGVPYELWVYQAGGEPLLERDRVHEIDLGMRFLFVDRDGHGRYKLERSSTISIK